MRRWVRAGVPEKNEWPVERKTTVIAYVKTAVEVRLTGLTISDSAFSFCLG